MSKISLVNVNKSYKDTTVIEDLNLEIEPGERLILLGPSGCGKSTILGMIAGLTPVTSGQIYLGDTDVTDVASGERNVSMVFQNYALYPHMTVEKNITYALKRNGVKRDEIKKRLDKVLTMLELEPYRKRYPKDLSGGQRQRVALARATVKNSNFFLLDEPLSNLDAKLRVTARRELLKLHQEFNHTFVYVTHDQVEAMALGDRIVVLKDGVIQMVDTPENVYHYPKNIFTARFIGNPPMNIIQGKVEDGVFKAGAVEVNISNNTSYTPELNGKEICLGIRPEHIYISSGSESKGEVLFTENFGGEVAHTIQLGDNEVIAMNDYTIESSHVNMQFDIDKVQLFNVETGINYRYVGGQ